jgi:Tfp pilus assembly protein PilF
LTDAVDDAGKSDSPEPSAKAPAQAGTASGAAAAAPVNPNAPIRRALAEIRVKNYDLALTGLDEILASSPDNAQAHYLRAIVFVQTRHYAQASKDYQAAIKLSTDVGLSHLCETGLVKLQH